MGSAPGASKGPAPGAAINQRRFLLFCCLAKGAGRNSKYLSTATYKTRTANGKGTRCWYNATMHDAEKNETTIQQQHSVRPWTIVFLQFDIFTPIKENNSRQLPTEWYRCSTPLRSRDGNTVVVSPKHRLNSAGIPVKRR